MSPSISIHSLTCIIYMLTGIFSGISRDDSVTRVAMIVIHEKP